MQRIARKADDAVQADSDRTPEAVVFALSRRAGVAVVNHARLRKANKRNEAPQEPVRLVQPKYLIDHATTHQSEVTGVFGDVDFGDTSNYPYPLPGDDLDEVSASTRGALRVHDVETLPPALDHLRPTAPAGPWRSASMTATTSPDAIRRPAIVAAGWPSDVRGGSA